MSHIGLQLRYAADANEFEAGVAEAVRGGAAGDEALARALLAVGRARRVTIVAALGEAEGPFGVPVLRSLVQEKREDVDVRCAGLVALSKRIGVEASDVLVNCLADENESVQRYALKCLACVGDDRGWAQVYELLQVALSGAPPRFPNSLSFKTLSLQSENLAAIGYLARHLTTPNRRSALVDVVVGGWEKLYSAERQWLNEYCPSLTPKGRHEQKELDVGWITSWLCHPLMSVLYLR
jgi:hypothetical protein